MGPLVVQKKPIQILNYSCENIIADSYQLFWTTGFLQADSSLLSRKLLALSQHIEIKNIRLETKAARKPFAYRPDGSEIFFNISHSSDIFGLCIADSPVGLDVEVIRPIPNAAKLAKRFFSAIEHQQIAEMDETSASLQFLKLWTRKEAVIKAAGVGVPTHLSVDVRDGEIGFQGSAWKLETQLDRKKIYTVATLKK